MFSFPETTMRHIQGVPPEALSLLSGGIKPGHYAYRGGVFRRPECLPGLGRLARDFQPGPRDFPGGGAGRGQAAGPWRRAEGGHSRRRGTLCAG
jgi:hypothetical protein